MPAMLKALARRGVAPLMLAETARPFVTREFGVKRSGSTRKKLRQDWNRLSALGTVEVVNDRTPDRRSAGLRNLSGAGESQLEGRAGHRVAVRSPPTPPSSGACFSNLAARGNASVALLRVDGEAIAAQVLMYCGTTAYTWKTAFDANYGKYSPGTLLIDKITDELFAGPDIAGDQFLRRRSQLHGPAVGRAPNHGRHADRRRPGKIAGLPDGSRPAARLPAPAGPANRFRTGTWTPVPRNWAWHRRLSTSAIYYPGNISSRPSPPHTVPSERQRPPRRRRGFVAPLRGTA